MAITEHQVQELTKAITDKAKELGLMFVDGLSDQPIEFSPLLNFKPGPPPNQQQRAIFAFAVAEDGDIGYPSQSRTAFLQQP